MRTYNLFLILSGSEVQLLSTTNLATFVSAVQAISIPGNATIRYKIGAGGFQNIQGFRIEVIDP